MIWSSSTVATKVITATITPGASQRVCIKQILGTATAVTLTGSVQPGPILTATPINDSAGTYTFKKGQESNVTANQTAISVLWTCAGANDPDSWLIGATGQAITVTMDGTNFGAWADGSNGVLQVFGYLDGFAQGAANTNGLVVTPARA